DRVGDRELEGAREYLTGSFPLTIETPSQIALQILNAVFFGLNLNELQTYRERVDAVTVDEVQRVARSYLHPDRLTVVLVGDASGFLKQLPGAGFDKFEVIPLGDLDLSSPDLRRKPAAGRGLIRPASSVRPAPHASEVAMQSNSAKALLDRAIAAKGGLAKLKAIRTVRAEGTMTAPSIRGPIPFSVVTSIEYPDRFRVDAETPAGTVTQVYADGRYWIQDARGTNELPESARGQIQGNVQRDIVRVLVGASAGSLIVREVDADEPSQAALEVSGGGMSPLTLLVNRDNGLIEKARYVVDPDGRSEEIYSDYRNVEGIQVPFHTVVRRAGVPAIERDVRKIHFNVTLPAGLFVKPS
ncbi:MAG TPA: hypothetical protein VN716_09525, partial [Vicinamibacterales bacterium]|nr:hypothetical protein [Vicinamibacterales bacterium]